MDAAIGAAKHANRKLALPERTDAASSILQILENRPLAGVKREEMKGAVGMRNAIVHDYLNLDWQLIQAVIDNENYVKVGLFVDHCCRVLSQN